ncbi:hypothetical protein EJ110_NYTH02511 [Nymphaea thermarum]|nr:hypothetical protein EJ110_NYTH02511 [Nymphaea thermarum]
MSSLVVFSMPKTGAGRVLPLREPNDFQSRDWLRPATVRCGLRLEVQESANDVFMLGMGFVGQFLGHQLKEEGCSSCISTSSGFHHQESLFTLQDATHLLISIPPSVSLGDPVLHFHRDLIWNSLKNGRLCWLCYLSSTSTYLHITFTPPKPENELAMARLEAENEWINLGCDLGVHVYVFRLGGIYGPGRRNIFNIIDDDPAPRSEVFSYARSLVMQRWPGKLDGIFVDQETLNLHAQTGERIEEKRVSNNRMKSELGVELLHPSYRPGKASLEIVNFDKWLRMVYIPLDE